MNITKKTVNNPVLILIVFSMSVLMGLAILKDININLMPDIKEPYLVIFATYKNAGPEIVETTVTQVIEDAMVSINNLKKITSTSSEGLCEIGLEFNYGTNIDEAATQVRDALEEIKELMPAGMKSPAIYKINKNEGALMDIVVIGRRSESEIKYIAEKKIKKSLMQANGVAQATIYGGKTPAVCVELEQNRLAAFGVSVSEISAKLDAENKDFGAGKITENSTSYVLRAKGKYLSVEDIANTIILKKNDYNVKLSDLGKVYMGFENTIDEVYIDGQAGVYVSIKKQSGANAVKVARNIYEKLEEIKAELPSDIELKIVADESVAIADALNTLYESAWQGIILAVLILFVFLRNFKSTFIVGLSIPISIIITLLLMSIMNITLNIMTLTGLILGIGMVVDASIVMTENIYSYRLRGTKPKVAAILGTQEMIASVLSGNITTIVVFVPFLLFINNLEWIGLMAKDLIYTIVSAVVSSLFVAIFLVPVLAGVYLPLRNPNEKPVRNKALVFVYGIFEKGFTAIEKTYSAMLKSVLRHRTVTIIGAFVLLFGSLGLVFFINIEAFPEAEGQAVSLNITLPIGTSIDKTRDVVKRFEKYVAEEIEGYNTMFSSVGSSDGAEMVSATNCGSISIFLPPPSQQKDTPNQIKKKLQKHFSEFAGVQFVFASESMDAFAGSDIDISVKGADLETFKNTCNQILAVLEKNKNLTNIKIDLKTGLPQIEIEIDRKRANSLGVSIEAAATELNNCLAGAVATKYNHKGNEYNVIVGLQQKDKQSLLDLDKIFVQGTNGPVMLSNFVKLTKNFSAVSIKHENKDRAVHITASFSESSNIIAMQQSVKNEILSQCYIPDGIVINFDGSSKMLKEKTEIFAKIIVLAFLMVFGVMASMYGSFKKPFINMLTIPFLFTGVILIHILTSQSLSVMSCLGLVMLVGIVVNNGIILVDYTGLLVARGHSVQDACYEAGVSRLRPVLMTTLTTVLGMLPMCFSKSGSATLVQPIGLCVVGGLLSSTFVTLLLIPVIYSVMCGKEKGDSLRAPELEYLRKNENYSRVEIVANQAVQENIVELLEKEITSIEYTLEENVYGKGRSSRKLGNSTWPEMNFRMTVYTNKENSVRILELVESVKQRFVDSGISLFVM